MTMINPAALDAIDGPTLTLIDVEVYACDGCGEPLTVTAPLATDPDAAHLFVSFMSGVPLVHPIPHIKDRAIARECEAHHPVCTGDRSDFTASNLIRGMFVRAADGVPVVLVTKDDRADRMGALERTARVLEQRAGSRVSVAPRATLGH